MNMGSETLASKVKTIRNFLATAEEIITINRFVFLNPSTFLLPAFIIQKKKTHFLTPIRFDVIISPVIAERHQIIIPEARLGTCLGTWNSSVTLDILYIVGT